MMITYWPRLGDKTAYEVLDLSWDAFVDRLSRHTAAVDKKLVPGFSAYTLRVPDGGDCGKVSAVTGEPHPKGVHRCNDCVDEMTAAVFDADQGPIAECHRLLVDADASHIFTTSYSHRPEKPSYRLVIQLSAPVPDHAWKPLRLRLIERFRIPADKSSSSAPAQFYHLPSHPPGATPEVLVHRGQPLDVERYVVPGTSRYVKPKKPEGYKPAAFDKPVDTAALLERLRAVVSSKARKKSEVERKKAGWLKNAIAGEVLCEKGERREALWRTSGVIADALSEQPPEVLFHLLYPSLTKMIAAGTTATEDYVRRAIVTGLEDAAARKAAKDAVPQNFFDNWIKGDPALTEGK